MEGSPSKDQHCSRNGLQSKEISEAGLHWITAFQGMREPLIFTEEIQRAAWSPNDFPGNTRADLDDFEMSCYPGAGNLKLRIVWKATKAYKRLSHGIYGPT